MSLYFMYEANPYYGKLQINKEPDTQNAPTGRFLRDKIQTDLTFRGDDYQRILGLQRESEDFTDASVTEYAIVAVAFWERFEDDSQQDYMAACMYFNRADAEVNFSERYVQPKLKPLDNYTWLLDKYNTKKNIVGLSLGRGGIDVSSLRLPFPTVIQLYVEGSNTVTNICGDTCWEQEVDPMSLFELCVDPTGDDVARGFWLVSPEKLEAEVPNFYASLDGKYVLARTLAHYSSANSDLDFAPLSRWYNHAKPDGTYSILNDYGQGIDETVYYVLKRVHKVPSQGVEYDQCFVVMRYNYESFLHFQETNEHTAKPTEFGIYQPMEYYTNENLPVLSSIQVKPMPFSENEWGSYSCWVSPVDSDTVELPTIGNSVVNLFTHTTLYEWVENCYSLQATITGLLRAYGIAVSFATTAHSSSLIYGHGKLNYLGIDDLLLIPATNITRGRYTQAAQKMELSLKDILDELCGMCNAGWHIDGTGLHIEGNEYYDAGRTYNGISYNPQLDFETIVDEFNGTSTLYGQIVSSPDTSNLWHTLTMNGADTATKHFKQTEMQAKAPYLAKDKTLSPTFAYDLLRAIVLGDVEEDAVICVGCDFYGSPEQYLLGMRQVEIAVGTLVEGKARTVSAPQQQAILLNKSFSWPFLKGRFMYGLPADRTLIEWGWIARQYWTTAMGGAKAYTAPHRSMKIHLPIVSELYTQNWQLVKTTLGYGTVRKMDIDMVARVADVTVDIIEYNI